MSNNIDRGEVILEFVQIGGLIRVSSGGFLDQMRHIRVRSVQFGSLGHSGRVASATPAEHRLDLDRVINELGGLDLTYSLIDLSRSGQLFLTDL